MADIEKAARRIVDRTVEACAQAEGFESFRASDWSPPLGELYAAAVHDIAAAVLRQPDADPAAPGGGVAWRIVDRDNLPEPQWMLVTNSLASQDAHGEMSHLWLTRMLHRAYDGSGSIESIVAFSEPDGSMIENVTHWRPALPTKE